MSKICLLFPGQGSQAIGMGKDLYDNYPEAKKVFETASEVLGFSMEELCFNGPEDKLKATENTQPALLTVSIAALRALESKGIKGEAFAGHSLGEYSAIVAAGILSFEDTLRLVRERGLLMAGADPDGKGGMAAIIGLTAEEIRPVLETASAAGVIEAANFNCPGQIVVSGDKKAIAAGEQAADDAGAARYAILDVSGAFHSSLMKDAAESYKSKLDQVSFKEGHGKVVSNVTASWSEVSDLPELLKQQIYSSVRWEESIRFLAKEGFDTFIETGSGKVLRGLMRRIDKSLKTMNAEDDASINKLVEFFGG